MNADSLRLLVDRAREQGRVPRVHGNGFVQLDLTPDGGTRLHVWDVDVPRQKTPTPIHDHVFDLRSTVLVGTLIHTEFAIHEADPGSHTVYRAKREEGTQNTTLVPDEGEVALTTEQHLLLRAGSMYRFPAGVFHESSHIGFTATVMEKSNAPGDYGSPRVLVPVFSEPDNAFHRDGFDPEMLWAIIGRLWW